MSDYPENFRYTKDHEWVALEGDQVKVGITTHAQSELGEVVFVELPEVDLTFNAGDAACVIESTKAASDVYAPIAGQVATVNEALNDDPSLVNSDSHGAGWMFTLSGVSVEAFEELMPAAEYKKLIGL